MSLRAALIVSILQEQTILPFEVQVLIAEFEASITHSVCRMVRCAFCQRLFTNEIVIKHEQICETCLEICFFFCFWKIESNLKNDFKLIVK